MKTNHYLYGTVMTLSREDTPRSIEENFRQMKSAGLNTVVIWPAVYWWEEKTEGYPFNTGRRVLEIAQRVGLGVVMELAGQLPMMEYIPDFLMKDDYYCVDENGHKRLKHTSFGWLNYFHPEVDALICDIFAQTARAYKDYPALVGYDIFNETAFNSYDEYTLQQFRSWLRTKYRTIDRLNAVWERSYTDFSQISFSPWMWMSIMPSADLGIFRKEAMGMILKRWHAAVKKEDPVHPTIADNIGSMITNGTRVYERPQDEYVLAEAVDEIGISFYPKQVAGCMTPAQRWNTFDAVYAAAGRRGYYISEMQSHIQALFNPTTAVRPYELKQWCCEALAAGAKGQIYWMWRPFTRGLQTSGRGLVDYKNRSTPRLEFAREFAKTVAMTGPLTPLRPRVGILFDSLCEDFQVFYTKCYGKVDQNIYLNSLCGAYEAMYDVGVGADIISLQELENYPVVILSNHIVIGEKTAQALEAYVRQGGVVICDGKTGIVDEEATMNTQLPGGEFNLFIGLDYLDSDYIDMDFPWGGQQLRGYYSKELTREDGAEVKAVFSDGTPALAERTHGKGRVITVNTHLWYGYACNANNADLFARYLADRFDLRQTKITAPLKVRICDSESGRYAFVFNYTDRDISGQLTGSGFDCDVTVKANDVLLLRSNVL